MADPLDDDVSHRKRQKKIEKALAGAMVWRPLVGARRAISLSHSDGSTTLMLSPAMYRVLFLVIHDGDKGAFMRVIDALNPVSQSVLDDKDPLVWRPMRASQNG